MKFLSFIRKLKKAISGILQQSLAISDNLRQSPAISGNLWQSLAFSGNLRQSPAICSNIQQFLSMLSIIPANTGQHRKYPAFSSIFHHSTPTTNILQQISSHSPAITSNLRQSLAITFFVHGSCWKLLALTGDYPHLMETAGMFQYLPKNGCNR